MLLSRCLMLLSGCLMLFSRCLMFKSINRCLILGFFLRSTNGFWRLAFFLWSYGHFVLSETMCFPFVSTQYDDDDDDADDSQCR